MHAAKALSLKPGSAVTSPLEEESCCAETLALTTSWAALPARLHQMGLIYKAAWKHQRVTFEKDQTAGDLAEGLVLWAPPPLQLHGVPGSLTGSSGPFTVQLFIGFLCSIGKIIMFFIEECLALIVEYIQGNCCGGCFLMFFSFMS